MEKHAELVRAFAHKHESGIQSRENEQRTLHVALLTAFTMVAEVTAGYITGSMALLADGWHMGTHMFAMGISWSAYILARKYRKSNVFSFGTGKFGILAGYTSALMLGVTALWLMYESIGRLVHPVKIDFFNAMLVTIIGLAVNLLSVLILQRGDSHDHAHAHAHDHDHDHGGQDHNYRAAYFHVLADTLTSFMALAALAGGRYLGWVFLDPLIGIVGGILILKWAWNLLRDTGLLLLDGGAASDLRDKLKRIIESDEDSKVADLHLWYIDSENLAGIVSVVSGTGLRSSDYHLRVKGEIRHLTHLSIEVHHCENCSC